MRPTTIALTISIAVGAGLAAPGAGGATERASMLDALRSLSSPGGAAPVIEAAQCSQRLGPFATQRRAWEVWRWARDEAARRGPGYGVSNGIFICYLPSRAYCINVFYPC